MRRSIAAFTTVASLLGFASAASAQVQSPPASPAALLGVQERSVNTPTAPSTKTAPTVQGESTFNEKNPLVLYRLDSKTRVILGPVYKSTDPSEFPVTDSTGDNRVQLMHDLDQ